VGDADNGEDKVEQAARASNHTVADIITQYKSAFLSDLSGLNIKTTETIFPHASQHIAEQIELIKKLENKGFVYHLDDGIYFDTKLYDKYPELGHLNLDGQTAGTRIEENAQKRSPADFALWKFSGLQSTRLQEWDSPWGVGFPGWAIECSAMSIKYLGAHFDIHTGGEDHIPVHHTNERAQSECATGETFVNYWLHNAFITVDGKKMAKSEQNFYTITDLVAKGYSPLAYRYFILGAHYRSPLNFTFEALAGAKRAWQKINNMVWAWPSGGQCDEQLLTTFMTAINNDLNTAKALAILHETMNANLEPSTKRATIEKFDEVLGILNEAEVLSASELTPIPEEILSLVQDREIARERADWGRADLIRAEIEAKGYEVEDTPEGPAIKSRN